MVKILEFIELNELASACGINPIFLLKKHKITCINAESIDKVLMFGQKHPKSNIYKIRMDNQIYYTIGNKDKIFQIFRKHLENMI